MQFASFTLFIVRSGQLLRARQHFDRSNSSSVQCLLTSVIPAQLTSIINLRVSLNHNSEMCGPSLVYGVQLGTDIGDDCPGPPPSKWFQI